MKNAIKTIGIIAIIAIMGLGVFTSCEEAKDPPSLTVGGGAKTTLTITGLSTYDGMYVSGGIVDTVTEDMYLFIFTQINSTSHSVTVNVLNDSGTTQVSLEGTGYIVLFINDTNNPTKEQIGNKYTGITYATPITPGANNIAFSAFVKQ